MWYLHEKSCKLKKKVGLRKKYRLISKSNKCERRWRDEFFLRPKASKIDKHVYLETCSELNLEPKISSVDEWNNVTSKKIKTNANKLNNSICAN